MNHIQEERERIQNNILKSYNGTEDLIKGGLGSGRYQHHNNPSDGYKAHLIAWGQGRPAHSAKTSADLHSDKFPNGKHALIIDTGGVYKHFLIDKKDDSKEITLVPKSEYEKYTGVKGADFKEDVDNLTPSLEKGGEGSRGGKVIGHTKSGKPVYDNRTGHHKKYNDFTSDDHHEAATLHAGNGSSRDIIDSHRDCEEELERGEGPFKGDKGTRVENSSNKKIASENQNFEDRPDWDTLVERAAETWDTMEGVTPEILQKRMGIKDKDYATAIFNHLKLAD